MGVVGDRQAAPAARHPFAGRRCRHVGVGWVRHPVAMDEITVSDDEVIRRALAATVDGPYFPECEFHALFDLTRK